MKEMWHSCDGCGAEIFGPELQVKCEKPQCADKPMTRIHDSLPEQVALRERSRESRNQQIADKIRKGGKLTPFEEKMRRKYNLGGE